MTAPMLRTALAVLATAAVTTAFAGDPPRWLPMSARVMETADIASRHGPRRLALWLAGAKEFRNEDGFDPGDVLTCPEQASGRYYVQGRARLSLVDGRRSRLRQTVLLPQGFDSPVMEIPTEMMEQTLYDPEWFSNAGRVKLMSDIDIDDDGNVVGDGMNDVFAPLFTDDLIEQMSRGDPVNLYVSSQKLYGQLRGGADRVMRMRDLNGDGLPHEFALYASESCSDLYATVLGYSARRDRVIWYRFHLRVNDEGRWSAEDTHWIPFAFMLAAPKNGLWRFTVQYPEYPPRQYHYAIRYDAAREQFTGTETIVTATYPP